MSTTSHETTSATTDHGPGGLDEQLKDAAMADLPLPPRQRTAVAAVVAAHLAGPTSMVFPSGEAEWAVTEYLADAVERITGSRPYNQMQVRSRLRRWAVLRATAGTLPTR